MPDASSLLVFAAACIVLLVVPGPAVLYIVARSASQGRRAGLASVAGIHTGTAVHVLAAMVGLSALIAASATAFTAVKLAGAAYLVWLGIRALRARDDEVDPAAPVRPMRSLRRIYLDGVVVNILNPKTGVFFLAFVPQFVDPAAGNVDLQLAVLGSVFIGLGLLTDGLYALVGASAGARLRRSQATPRSSRRVRRATAGVYVGLGAVTAFTGGTHA